MPSNPPSQSGAEVPDAAVEAVFGGEGLAGYRLLHFLPDSDQITWTREQEREAVAEILAAALPAIHAAWCESERLRRVKGKIDDRAELRAAWDQEVRERLIRLLADPTNLRKLLGAESHIVFRVEADLLLDKALSTTEDLDD
jgi:hypothetical protein